METIKTILSAPKNTITGLFNLRIAFANPVESLDAANVRAELLHGDGIGNDYTITGRDRNWYIHWKAPDNCVGRSKIHLTGSVHTKTSVQRIVSQPVILQYDTRRIVRAVISAPTKMIIGAFNSRITFARPIHILHADNIVVRTVSGDPIGVNYQVKGEGHHWYIYSKMPEGRVGSSEISLTGSVHANGALETIDANPVLIRYDTQRAIGVTFGDVRYQSDHCVLPVTFQAPVIGVSKKHFRLTTLSGHPVERLKCYLYGQDSDYEFVLIPNGYRRGRFRVEMTLPVRKANGIVVDVDTTPIEISYPLED